MARDLQQLHPAVQAKAQELAAKCKERGLIVKITDCLRTKDEQAALYAQGRTAPGSIVTNARYPYSFHCWGMAFDVCRNDGKGAYYDKDGFFTKVGKIGKSLGLTWGGEWKTITDKPHFQLDTYGSSATEMVRRFGTPERFMATWPKEEGKMANSNEPSPWAKDAWTWAKEAKLLDGTRPKEPISREELAAVLWRFWTMVGK